MKAIPATIEESIADTLREMPEPMLSSIARRYAMEDHADRAGIILAELERRKGSCHAS